MNKVFVINLESRPDRLNRFIKDAPISDTDSIPFDGFKEIEVFTAVVGKDVPKEYLKKYENNDFNYRNGIIGCAESHITLWERLINDQEHSFYIIFEDDAKFDLQFNSHFQEFLEFNINWDLFYFGGPCSFADRKAKHGTTNGKFTVPNENAIIESKTSLSTIGYAISKNGAKVLLDSVSNGIRYSIDWFMIKNFHKLNVFSMNPYIVFSNDPNDTDIQHDYTKQV